MSAFSLPARVVRRPGALDELGTLCSALGQRIWVIGGHQALAVSRRQITESLAAAGLTLLACDWFGGLCSRENVAAQASKARELGAEVIVTVGGGRAMDTGKSVAAACQLPVITVPTIAATCAAFSTVSARYHADGTFMDVELFSKAPAAVVIDSQIIASAPVRWLAAGMGDTLAKWYEFRAISEARETDGPTLAIRASSRLCYDLIERYGPAAYQAAASRTPGPELDNVLDAIFIHAGITSIMGTAPAAASHAIFEGFTALEKTRELGHGILVGYGNLCLLVLEQRSPAEISEAIKLARDCGLPLRLADLAELDQKELAIIARAAVATHDMSNMPFAVGESDVIAAMQQLETF
jgi:glycerol dehydrogenase-like iron-containing ADH family enzyme